MQSLGVINEKFTLPPSGLKFYGDIDMHQVSHLECLWNHLDTKYNTSLFEYPDNGTENTIDSILIKYYSQEGK